MAKKSNVPEVLGPVDPVPNVRTQLEQFIEQKLAEMMDGDAGVFEPFFQRKAISAEIRKLQTVPQQRKWHNYFEEWGCLMCEKKNWPHRSNGMCQSCYGRTLARLQAILRLTEKERSDAPSFAPDRLTELASGAVRKQLSAETSAPAYVTRAEHKAQRQAERKAQREKARHDRIAATREKRARCAEVWRQARALRVEQNLTWREIAQRLDPDFDKDPEAAIARIEMGAHRVALVRDLTDLAHAAVRRRSKKNSAS